MHSSYTQEIGDKICEIISTSNSSLRNISAMEAMPALSTITKWLRDFPDFSAQYARAKEAQADILAGEIIEISDDKSNDTLTGENGEYGNSVAVARDRLRVDARKWAASKLAPKKYGDKVEQTVVGDADRPVVNEHRFIIEDMSDGS